MGEKDHNDSALTLLNRQLDALQWRMSQHVMGGGPVAQSLALIEQMRASGATDREIDTALHQKRLPSVVDVGRKSVLHLPSWWWLYRKKKRLERKIARYQS